MAIHTPQRTSQITFRIALTTVPPCSSGPVTHCITGRPARPHSGGVMTAPRRCAIVLAHSLRDRSTHGIWRLRPAAGTGSARSAVVAGDGHPRRRDADPRAHRELPPGRV